MVKNDAPTLMVNSLVKNYGGVQALRGVSFDVQPGEVFGLLGPNGAGKTSLISIVITLEKATSGEAVAFGKNVACESSEVKSSIGWVPQEIINHGYFTVDEILRIQAGYYGVANPDAKIEELLLALDLNEHREKKVRQLSGGMKRRLMIAKALVHDPRLLLLDEPTAGVDVELRLKLWEFVKEQKGKGLSILLTTHYLEEAEVLCDRVAIIHKGKIQAMGGTQELIDRFSSKRVSVRLNSGRKPVQHPDLIRSEGGEWTYKVHMNKPIGALFNELKVSVDDIVDIKVDEGSLEDVFVHFTQGDSV